MHMKSAPRSMSHGRMSRLTLESAALPSLHPAQSPGHKSPVSSKLPLNQRVSQISDGMHVCSQLCLWSSSSLLSVHSGCNSVRVLRLRHKLVTDTQLVRGLVLDHGSRLVSSGHSHMA
eukprot:3273480-Amphidinium_carterae.1